MTLEGHYLSDRDDDVKTVEFPPQGSLTPNLIQYYTTVVGVILGNSEQMLQVSDHYQKDPRGDMASRKVAFLGLFPNLDHFTHEIIKLASLVPSTKIFGKFNAN